MAIVVYDRDARAYSRKTVVYATTDPDGNTACPVHLLIILAMRVGAVSSVTLDHLLEMARSRNDRTVQWQHPEWPVLAAIDPCSYHLVTAKPAAAHQIPISVQLAAGLAGITESVIAYDGRMGAMRDLTNLVTPVRGAATAAVAKAGGHTSKARYQGVTDQHIGHQKQDQWTKGLGEADTDDGVVPAIGARPFKKPRTQSHAIDLYCQENALDKDSKKDRTKASVAIGKRERILWADEQRNPGTISGSNIGSNLQPRKLFHPPIDIVWLVTKRPFLHSKCIYSIVVPAQYTCPGRNICSDPVPGTFTTNGFYQSRRRNNEYDWSAAERRYGL